MSTLPQCTVHYTVCTSCYTVKLDVKSSSLGLRLKTGRLTTMGRSLYSSYMGRFILYVPYWEINNEGGD